MALSDKQGFQGQKKQQEFQLKKAMTYYGILKHDRICADSSPKPMPDFESENRLVAFLRIQHIFPRQSYLIHSCACSMMVIDQLKGKSSFVTGINILAK